MTENRLKPCPFCGSEAILKTSWALYFRGASRMYAVGCGNPDECLARNDVQDNRGAFKCAFPTEQEAIDHWNTRVTEGKLQEENLKLRQVLTSIHDDLKNGKYGGGIWAVRTKEKIAKWLNPQSPESKT